METIILKLQALTPIWTGDVNREFSKIKETGLVGSLRWWYESLVRGLGGYACDPTSDERCELNPVDLRRAIQAKPLHEALDEQICPACQLFGCSGWSRIFRLEVSKIGEGDIERGMGPMAGLKRGKIFHLGFIFFMELRPEQKWLFKKTLWIIENYGAIGGRITWKPNGGWGTSYGLIKIKDYGKLEEWDSFSNKDCVKNWLIRNKEKINRENIEDWFNFRFYWIVNGKYLTREQINGIVKRNPANPKDYLRNATAFDRWLGGKIGESKKIFSFDGPKKVFGYVRKPEEVEEIRKRLESVLGIPLNFKTGEEILEGLE